MVRTGRPPKSGEMKQTYGVSLLPSVREKAYKYGINMSELLQNALEREFKNREDKNEN
jgi:post-segregation antitoxin (ccd killing protein)